MVIALVSTTIYFSEIVISNSAHLLRKCRSAVYLVYVCITSVYILRGLYVYGPTVIGINCRGARPRLLFCLMHMNCCSLLVLCTFLLHAIYGIAAQWVN